MIVQTHSHKHTCLTHKHYGRMIEWNKNCEALGHTSAENNTIYQLIIHYGSVNCQDLQYPNQYHKGSENVSVKLYCQVAQPPRPYTDHKLTVIIIIQVQWAPYKRWTLYLAVCSQNAVGDILNWRFWVLYVEKPMLVV